eukprot:9452258-Alexandrium_andersonii.AAC.1
MRTAAHYRALLRTTACYRVRSRTTAYYLLRRAPSQPVRGRESGGLQSHGAQRGKSVGPQARADVLADGALQRREGK